MRISENAGTHGAQGRTIAYDKNGAKEDEEIMRLLVLMTFYVCPQNRLQQ